MDSYIRVTRTSIATRSSGDLADVPSLDAGSSLPHVCKAGHRIVGVARKELQQVQPSMLTDRGTKRTDCSIIQRLTILRHFAISEAISQPCFSTVGRISSRPLKGWSKGELAFVDAELAVL